jgi:hypothetical protein
MEFALEEMEELDDLLGNKDTLTRNCLEYLMIIHPIASDILMIIHPIASDIMVVEIIRTTVYTISPTVVTNIARPKLARRDGVVA